MITPTARELVAARKAQAPTKPNGPNTEVAKLDNRSYRERYLDEVAPSRIVGRMVKFSKDGTFITTDDSAEVPEDAKFMALCDQTLIGWLKFNEPGTPPDSDMRLLYGDWQMPLRSSLGDLDESKWAEGLDGKPADPWQHHQYLVLQNVETAEMFTFVTSSKTGRSAVGHLIKHYDRTRRSHPGEVPIVQLRTGGFKHSDSRVGWVTTPVFQVVGRAPADNAVKPEPFQDVMPF